MNKTMVWFAAAALASAALAQETRERIQIFNRSAAPPPGAPGETFDVMIEASQTMSFVSSEFSWEDKLVKGAPYSAEAVTETTQMLVDGNRISRKNTAQVARDGEGRTRREQTLASVGPWAAGKPHKTILINDPVAGAHYVLNPETKEARKLSLRKDGPPGAGAVGVVFHREIDVEGAPKPGIPVGPNMIFEGFVAKEAAGAAAKNYRQESLGKQTLEGVSAEGTRSVMTIAAGEIGNDRPIEIVSERWYSPELQTVVMSRRNDPRFGETVYKLTQIRRGEPGQALFEVPADYAMKEGPPAPFEMKMRKKKPE